MKPSKQDEVIQSCIEQSDPYGPLKPLNFDLREYADYIEQNHLKQQDITEDILELFVHK